MNSINDGYSSKFSIENIFINPDSILSISDYKGDALFLLKNENGFDARGSYSIIKVLQGSKVQEVIACGSARELYESLNGRKEKRLLNE